MDTETPTEQAPAASVEDRIASIFGPSEAPKKQAAPQEAPVQEEPPQTEDPQAASEPGEEPAAPAPETLVGSNRYAEKSGQLVNALDPTGPNGYRRFRRVG